MKKSTMKWRATRRANWFIELITLANRHSYEIEYNDKHQMEQTRKYIHTSALLRFALRGHKTARLEGPRGWGFWRADSEPLPIS